MQCTYSKKLFIRAYALYEANKNNPEKLKESFAEAFTDPEVALTAVRNWVNRGGYIPPVNPKPTTSKIQLNVDENDVSSYFTDTTQYNNVKKDFKERILASAILFINKNNGLYTFINGNSLVKGTPFTVVQQNILKYKRELANKIITALKLPDVKFNLNTSNEDLTNAINNVISSYEEYLHSNPITENKVYNAYVILKNFDLLLKSQSAYIKIDSSYLKANLDGVTKYSLNPKVEHYSGFSGKDDSADIMKQISDLAETILSLTPEIDANGKILNSNIGTAGFNGAMETLKQAILYTTQLGTDTYKFRESYHNGEISLLDPKNKYNLNNLIGAFIRTNTLLSGGRSDFSKFRQTYLHNKLRGINFYLFGNNTPAYIKNMFSRMFYKTEPTSYRAYTTDENGFFSAKTLESRMILSQKFAIQNVANGGFKIINESNVSTNLIQKYRPTIQSSDQIETLKLTNRVGKSVFIDYSNGKTITIGNITGDLNVLKEFLQDGFSYIIPSDYATCMGETNYKWENDFAPIVVLGAKLALKKTGGNYGNFISGFIKANGEFNLKPLNNLFLHIGERLGIIYGDSVKSVVPSLSGSHLPLFQLTSLEYNWQSCLYDAKKNPNSAQRSGLIFSDEDLLLPPQIRSEVEIDGEQKAATNLSRKELNKINILDDFFFPYLFSTSEADSAIYLQNAVFSDKARHFLMGWRLNTIIKNDSITKVFGKNVTLKDIIKTSLNDNGEKLQEVIRLIKRDRHVLVARNIIDDYAKVFPEQFKNFTFSSDGDINAKNAVEVLLNINNFIANNFSSIDDLRNVFEKKHVGFIEETHATINNLNRKVNINETFFNYLSSTSTKENWAKREMFLKNKYAKNLSTTILNGLDEGLNRKINGTDSKSYIDILTSWKPDKVKNFKGFYNEHNREFSFVSKDGNLHPAANVAFYLNQFLNGDFNSLTVGEVWAHPNKNESKDASKYLEYSEASRYVNQIKRLVINGATIHSFAQGIKDENGNNCGVTSKIHVAVFKDRKASVFTPKGVEDTIDSQDGAGRCTALQARLENNSVVDAFAGENKKTIVHDIRSGYNTPTLLKWAVYAITNNLRRLSYGSIDNLENLTKKMYSLTFNKNINLKEDYQSYKEKNGSIWIKDPITLNYDELVEFSKNEKGEYIQILRDENGNIREGKSYTLGNHTLYDIDQIFGGCFTAYRNEDGSFIENEASVDMLTNIAIKYNLRNKQIAYAVNTSACKVGAENINPVSSISDDSELYYFDMSTKYGGIMMDADHELEDANVTEMTQMISSIIESGLKIEDATSVYENIGNIVWNNEKVQKFNNLLKGLNSEDEKVRVTSKIELNKLVSEIFAKDFQNGNKDTIGLAQAFTKKFIKAQKEGKDFSLPFSDPTLYGAYISNIASFFNKESIRRKYEGFAAVQNPSYNNVQLYGNNLLFSDFNKKCKDILGSKVSYIEGLGFSGLDYNGNSHFYSSYVQLAAGAWTIGGELNPFLKSIKASDIQFEDCIFIEEDGKLTQYYIDNFDTYDTLRHLKDYSKVTNIYRNDAAPKNLKGTDTLYTMIGVRSDGEKIELGTYSYYDNDSVRAAHYLNNIDKKDPYRVQKENLITKLGVKSVEECNALTQNFLNKLTKGKELNSLMDTGQFISDEQKTQAYFDKQDFLGDTSGIIAFYSKDYKVIPAQVIMGRYQLNKLGIEKTDKITDITSSDFFYNKINNNTPLPLFNLDEKTTLSVYDKVLYHNGEAYLIKIGKENSHLMDGVKFNSDASFNQIGNDFRYNNEIIVSDIEGIKGSFVSDGTNTYHYINVSTEEDFEKLLDSNYFYTLYRNNVPSSEYKKETDRFREEKIRLAKDQYTAFKECFNFVGARIPTQNMQSYMPFEVAAFTDSDKNEIYLPKQNTYLTGSDYDIDKLYLLTVSLLDNGELCSGSALQKYIGYEYASKLFTPNNKTFKEDSNGVGIPSFILNRLAKPIYQWTDADKEAFVFLANKINDADGLVSFQRGNISEEIWNKQKENFLKLLNKHSHTKSYLKDSPNALKTRVFNGVRKITLSPEVQLKAQIAVDECTKEFKKKAANTVSGTEEKEISPELVTSTFLMQVQNMLGRSVVGIGAVSLKTYYLLSYNANKKANKVKRLLSSGIYKEAYKEFKSMLLKNPFLNDQVTVIANTNLEGILEGFRKAPENIFNGKNSENSRELKEKFLKQVEDVINKSKAVDASDYLSAIISLAADNAKDLALPKLNATDELVDFYTTAFMLGTPFKAISEKMTSPIFNWVTEIGENNIFDSFTKGNKVKNILKVLEEDKIPGCESYAMDRVISYYNRLVRDDSEKINPNENIYNNKEILDKIINAFDNGDLLDQVPDFITSEMWEAYNEAVEEYQASADSEGRSMILPPPWTKKDLAKVLRGIKILRTKLELLTPENKEILNSLVKSIDYTEQMTTLGQVASINGGLKTNTGQFISYRKNLENRLNTKFKDKFILDTFINTDIFKQSGIIDEAFKYFPDNFNILETLFNSPNFYNMVKVYNLVEKILKNTCFVFNATDALVESITSTFNNSYFPEIAYSGLNRYLNDFIVYNFLINSNFSINLQELSNLTKSSLEIYKPNGQKAQFTTLNLKTMEDVASFKSIMEESIIPYLKLNYNDNVFIRDLCLVENSKLKTFTFSLPLSMMNIDSDEVSLTRYNQYLASFNSIAKDSIAGNNIGDLFFLYNLIINKNSYGNQSLTRIFEDLVNSTNIPPIISIYYNYIGNLDSGKIKLNLSKDEAIYYLNKYVGTKLKQEKSLPKINLGKDFTFDLPLTGKLNIQKYDIGVEKVKQRTFGNLSAREVLTTFSDILNQRNKLVSLIRDESKNSPKAYIENGLIKFNLAKINSLNAVGVGIHEIAHFVFASLKAKDVNDPSRLALYNLLNKMKNDEELEKYKRYYYWLNGSDLEEEILCNKIEKVLTGKISDDTEVELVNNKLVLEGIKNLFPDGVTDLSEIVNLNLEEAIEKFAYSIFNYIGDISQDYMLANQKVGGIKTYLINNKDINNKLEQDCNG